VVAQEQKEKKRKESKKYEMRATRGENHYGG